MVLSMTESECFSPRGSPLSGHTPATPQEVTQAGLGLETPTAPLCSALGGFLFSFLI